ncbi:chemotaxis protein [Vulgatibacter sp.]|uniref:chemotaxis protein n=1 Tax=Vulgatibacter sp. TaxID=1971226 RepID=UPI003562016D
MVACRWAGVGLVVAVALAQAACFTVGKGPSELQQQIGGSEMSPAELRTRVRSLAGRFSAELEILADELASRTDDPAQRLALTRFKLNAIPQMQAALFVPDPVAALVDAWALVVQLRNALVGLAERPASDPEALALTDERFEAMEDELAALWRQLTGREEIPVIEQMIQEWAAEHPLDSVATRQSTVGLLSALTERSGVSPLGAASFLLEDTQDLALRMELLGNFVPRQARWQAELFLRERLADRSMLASGETPQELLDAVAGMLQATGDLPALLDAEREAVFSGIRGERVELQGFASEERAILLEALREERVAVMAQSERIGEDLVDRAFERSTELVDRILLRLLLLAAILGLVAVAVALILVRGRRERRQLVVQRTSETPP